MDRVWDEMWDKNSAVLIHEPFSIACKNLWKTSPPPFLLSTFKIQIFDCYKELWQPLNTAMDTILDTILVENVEGIQGYNQVSEG